MSSIKFKRGQNANLNNVPIEDGSILFTEDTAEMYLDVNNERKIIVNNDIREQVESHNFGDNNTLNVETIGALGNNNIIGCKAYKVLKYKVDNANNKTYVQVDGNEDIASIPAGTEVTLILQATKTRLGGTIGNIVYVPNATEIVITNAWLDKTAYSESSDAAKNIWQDVVTANDPDNLLIFPDYPSIGTTPYGENIFVAGKGNKALGIYSIAMGRDNSAENKYGVAIGRNNKAGYAAFASGRDTQALGDQSHTEGQSTKAISNGAHAEGGYTQAMGDNAHAEGGTTIAKGRNSHAEGLETKALGDESHAEGVRSQANGAGSHAEGRDTIAGEPDSHAEGRGSKTSGTAAHAEGVNSEAKGWAAHAEGEGTIADAPQSHAQNYETQALGQYSSAAGIRTITNKDNLNGQFVVGKYNVGKVDTLFEVGSGKGPNVRANALEVKTDGTVYSQAGKLATETFATNEANRIKSEILGGATEEELNTLKELSDALNDDENFAATVLQQIGNKVDKVDGKGLSTNDFTNEEKSKLDAMPSPLIIATIGYVGEMTENKVDKVDGKGLSTNDFTNEYKNQLDNEIVGKFTDVEGAEIFNDYENNRAVSRNSHAEGVNTKAGTRAFKITALSGTVGGEGTYTLDSTTGIQVGMRYSAVTSFALYNGGTITAVNGNTVTVDNYPGHALNTAVDDPSNFNMYNLFIIVDHPELGTVDAGFNAHTEGNGTFAAQVDTHAEGRNTRALGKYAHTEGNGTQAGHISHAEGNGTQALGDQSHAEGCQTKALKIYSHAEGYNTTANGSASHSEGSATYTDGDNSHAEGNKTAIRDVAGETILDKYTVPQSHSSDMWNNGHGAHAEGQQTVASSNGAHAEGNSTYAIGSCSHSEGHQTLATGYQAHAEGADTWAGANYAHAQGKGTVASGISAHAEGSITQASADYSHAQGQKTTASGKHSHAEGYTTIASGGQSHAGGDSTIAQGAGSFAHGYKTQALGNQSGAFGSNTIAGYGQQFVIGRHNNNKADNLFEVGNGSSSSNKSNAFEVTKSGVAKASGKTLATEQYVNEKVANVVTSSDSTPMEIVASATQPTPVAGKTIIWIDTSAL